VANVSLLTIVLITHFTSEGAFGLIATFMTGQKLRKYRPWVPARQHYWRVYFPDEWGLALEREGRAQSFTVRGLWTRVERFAIIDRNCDGWDLIDLWCFDLSSPCSKRTVIQEYMPSSEDPTPYDSGEWIDYTR
jgi:hypothetical protein